MRLLASRTQRARPSAGFNGALAAAMGSTIANVWFAIANRGGAQCTGYVGIGGEF
jgi:hypothetical protein